MHLDPIRAAVLAADNPAAIALLHIGTLTSSALSCSHSVCTVIMCVVSRFNYLLCNSKSVYMAGSILVMSAVSSRACKHGCLRGIQQSAGLYSVQNEVAYEYFGDRFSVTAERKYKQVSCLYTCQTSA